MKLAVIGHGYVGLVTAAVFADLGNTVFCVGRTPEKIANLKKGILPFFEPGLEEVVKRNLQARRLSFTLNYEEAVSEVDIIFISVGTPSSASGEADLSSVFEAAEKIAKSLKDFSIITCKSTVPVGTNRKIAKILNKFKPKKASFEIASCPEFLREGTALYDTLNPDRIVIGFDSKKARDMLLELHKPINGHFVTTTIETAEVIKYAANTMLATKISFANAMAMFCEAAGADVEQVMEAIGLDQRIGRQFLAAGIGYGGSCFPKDVKALVAMARQYKTSDVLFSAVEETNRLAHLNFVNKVDKFFSNKLKDMKIGVLGLAFKPNTDDMRDAPSIPIINSLINKGAKIFAYDPKAKDNAQRPLPTISYVSTPYEAAEAAQALLILTEWNEFKQLDLEKIKKLLKKPVIFDGRNIYEPEKMKSLGFTYFGTGR